MRLAVAFVAMVGCGRFRFDDRLDAAVSPGDVDGAPDIASDSAPPSACPAIAFGPSPWVIAPGFRGRVMTTSLDQPAGVAVAGGAFGGAIFVTDTGAGALTRVDPATGQVGIFVGSTFWPGGGVTLLTTVLWDEHSIFDGQLYVADQGTSADGDSRMFRVNSAGLAALYASGPAPGLNDTYGMAFVNDATYGTGLMATGDTDVSSDNWGLWTFAGTSTQFSTIDAETLAFDAQGTYGGGLFAARPSDNGWSGDDSISRIAGNGTVASVLVTGLVGVHAIAFAPPGAFGGQLYAAVRSTGTLIAIDPLGATTTIASGITWDTYDSNMIAFSTDGTAMYVADHADGELICIDLD